LSSNTTPSYSYTTANALTGSSATFKVRVTDSRGRTGEKSASAITIAAYALPSITASAYRSNSSGTAQSDGTYLKITATASATPSGTGGNSITALKYSYKATTSSTWSTEANIPSGAVSGFSNTVSYDVRVRAEDKFGNSAYRYFTIQTASYTMDFRVGGTGVAFGKVAETDNLVESAWELKVDNKLDVTNQASLGSGYASVANLTAFNNAILTAYSAMSNGQISYLRLAPSASISPFGAYVQFCTIYKINSGYGAVETISYQNGSGAVKHSASIWNNTIPGWS